MTGGYLDATKFDAALGIVRAMQERNLSLDEAAEIAGLSIVELEGIIHRGEVHDMTIAALDRIVETLLDQPWKPRQP